MGEICEVCGEACPLVDHWYMGGATGEYEAAMAKHWGLGYERSQAALVAANARAEKAVAEIVNEQRRFGEMQREAWKLEEALAAARREVAELHNQLERLCQATESDPPFWYRLLKRVQAMSDEEWRTFISATLTGEDRG